MVMPKGRGFVDYPTFEEGYEALKRVTEGFQKMEVGPILGTVLETPIALIVLRTMLGFTPSEWAYITTCRSGQEVSQNYARAIDRRIRMNPHAALGMRRAKNLRLEAMIAVACQLLTESVPDVGSERIHRLDKADTSQGFVSLKRLSDMGVPYAMLLYERFLGRPFAGYRDSVSELVGDTLELAVERALDGAGISYRKTKRAERIPGFDQAPDFVVPSEFNPQVVIEAKLTEDDGTARDKVTRVQHLGELSITPEGTPKFEVIACIAGRGFGVRREDMKKLLLATRGKVFTIKTIDRLVDCSRLKEFKTR